MINIIKLYIQKLTISELQFYAEKQDIYLSEAELQFTYDFIKNNYDAVLSNPDNFNFENYQQHYSKENFIKINNLINKYKNYL